MPLLSLLPDHIQVIVPDNQLLIIEKYQGRKLSNVFLNQLLGFLGIAFWVYIFKILITLALWKFGIDWGYQQIMEIHGLEGFFDFVIYSAPFGITLCISLFIWAFWNFKRFHNKESRHESRLASIQDDAKWTDVNPELLQWGRQMQIVDCSYNQQGLLTGIQKALHLNAD